MANLGDKVIDKITKMEGIVTATHFKLDSPPSCYVEGVYEMRDGNKRVECPSFWINNSRLEVLEPEHYQKQQTKKAA